MAEQLAHSDVLDEVIARVSAELAERMRPEEDAIAQLETIPGVGRSVAAALRAEIGADLERFPTAKRLASWAGRCPGNHESAGHRRSGRTQRGSPWLRACLIQAAHAAARTKGTYLAAQDRRLAARRVRATAAVAVAHAILLIVYPLLTERTVYRDLGITCFDERDGQTVERRLVHRLRVGLYRVLDTSGLARERTSLFSDQTRLGGYGNHRCHICGFGTILADPKRERGSEAPRREVPVLCDRTRHSLPLLTQEG